ncbi:MAG: SMC-Scp complex subunit ScpB [Alphaproteobacteria bacterium]
MTPEQLEQVRMLEALLFAAAEPLDEASIADRMPKDADLPLLIEDLQQTYAKRGVNLVKRADRWTFQTAPDLAFLLHKEVQEERRLSRAANETLAIIAYHQPVTRAEIEEIRGVTVSKGTIDVLMETGWIRPRGRRQTPGRPVTYGVTDDFLIEFGLESVKDLPGLEELKAAGLLDSDVPPAFLAAATQEASEEEGADELPFAPPLESETDD